MFWGILVACMILPVWANWISDDRIRLSQKGIGEPFFLSLLGGIGASLSFIVWGWENDVDGIVVCSATGVALLVVIVKSIRGTLITKKEAEED